MLVLLCACARQHAPSSGTIHIDHAQAVRGSWDATAPPTTGWTPVKLIDFWNTRWPQHDGVVWYRLHWHQADANAPVGLLLNYVCLADAVYVNGSLIHRDPHLREPLSRSWIKPQYFLVDQPVLRQGENTLLVRVSGLAAYQPGFGKVVVGDPQTVQAQYRHNLLLRHDVQLFDQAAGLVLGVLFAMLWLFRRKDTTYGWFALTTLLSAGYAWNYIAASPWPFTGTDIWEAFNAALYVAAGASFTVFLLRYTGRRWRRIETALLLFTLAAFAFALLAPSVMGPHRGVWLMAGGVIYYVALLVFMGYAVRSRRTDHRVLAACLLIPVLVSGHDFLLYYGFIRSDVYLLALTSPLSLIGMGFVLAYRFAAAMRRVEGFNVELKHEVDIATTQLRDTLDRGHALALAHTRIGERLNLVRDLHDGFGGSLLGTIAALEHPLHPPEASQVVVKLKELRDDLRLVIDTTTHDQDTDLAGLLAPLHHRWSQRLEVAGIDSRWHLDTLDGLRLSPARSLDLLRLLQEALTNVLKHSQATRVDIRVQCDGERLQVDVHDDGRGFDPSVAHARDTQGGAGMASLRTRAARLGGTWHLEAAPGRGTRVRLDTSLQGIPQDNET